MKTLEIGNLVRQVTKLDEETSGINLARLCAGEGRNLLDVLGVSTVAQAGAALKAKSDAKDYTGLMLGDYLDITSDYGETFGNLTVRYEIVGMNHYDAFVDGEYIISGKGNITFFATRCVCKRSINQTSIKEYSVSSMKNWLNGVVYNNLKTALGVGEFKRILNFQQFNNGTYDVPDWCDDNDYNGLKDWRAAGSDYVYLPSIRELFGSHELGRDCIDNSKQFAIMSLVPSKACMKLLDGNQFIGWTRTPSRYPSNFCYVGNHGHSDNTSYNVAFGVRPAFNL